MYKQLLLLFFIFIFGSLNAQDNIHVVEKKHYFSSVDTKDTFQITLSGNEIANGKVTFRILTNIGDIILKESYPSRYLIGYGLIGEDENVKRQEKYIIKRMDEFFKEDNFSSPAIGLEDSCESDYSDCETWETLKNDQTAIGFYFLIGEEAGCWIAYSKKLKKVLRYYCCC